MTMHTETETPTTHSAMADGETSVPILQLKDVSYAYAKGGRNVLSDINYTFPSGSVTAIVGPSGAGKTTLLSLISGLTTPTGGEVLFEGHNLAKMDRYCYRSRDIGVIFQSFNLLPGLTVLENIMLTGRSATLHSICSSRCICPNGMQTSASCICRVANSSAWQLPAH